MSILRKMSSWTKLNQMLSWLVLGEEGVIKKFAREDSKNMCTSFIKSTEDNCYIAMNFDSNGMNYSISTRKKDWFIVYIDTGKVKAPSFGVHKSGGVLQQPNG